MDTIFALSSGAPPAAIALVRISGAMAVSAATALCGALPAPRRAGLRTLHDPRDGRVLDRGLVLHFPGPRSATGEDLVELHLHGGRAVVAAVEAALLGISGLRRAERGEFTRRALGNGVIDLTEAEGLGDLLRAETETQRRAALDVAHGSLRRTVEAISMRLLDVAAQVEAVLDFADESDVAVTATDMIPLELAAIADTVRTMLAVPPVERLLDGIRVVIAGPPNSGKSTLLNRLVGRDAAIVSPISGTTRDRIDVPVQAGGIAYLLTDTAGLAETTADEIERIGIERARAAMETADTVLWLGDDASPIASAIAVHARCDLPGREVATCPGALCVSAEKNVGIDELWKLIAERSERLLPTASETAINARQRAALSTMIDHVDAAVTALDDLIRAEEIRLALRALDHVTGRAGTDEMLDALFARFCIGK